MVELENMRYKKLNEIKWDYFTVTQKYNMKGVSKSQIRSYLGALTWMYENEGAGNRTHYDDFAIALEHYHIVVDRRDFLNDFNKVMRIWRDSNEKVIPREHEKEPILPPPVKKIKGWKKNGLTQLSLFSGAFGLDLGFMAAGFDPKLALDIDKDASETIKTNLPDMPFIGEDIGTISTKQLLEISDVCVGEVDVLVGGPPCQPFSTVGKRLGLNDPRASPLKEFVRVIKEAKPRCFVMEEVEGLQSARLKHITITERETRQLSPEEEKGSAFKLIVEMLKSTGYNITFSTLNAADYGAPQIRKRLIFIGLREGEPSLPEPTHTNNPQTHLKGKKLSPWTTFWEASADLQNREQEYLNFSKKVTPFMELVPPGGNWRNLPEDVVQSAMGGAYTSGGGKMGYYRRLAWDEPSPTVVTSPTQMATLFCHPEALRPLSVEEYKRLQGFPDDWYLPASTSAKYKLIGNAVPVHLSYAIALKVQELLGNEN